MSIVLSALEEEGGGRECVGDMQNEVMIVHERWRTISEWHSFFTHAW